MDTEREKRMNSDSILNKVARDIRYAFVHPQGRWLRRAVIATLAIGIGANAAISLFSMLHSFVSCRTTILNNWFVWVWVKRVVRSTATFRFPHSK